MNELESTKYRTDEPNPHPNYWKYTESIWIEKLDSKGEGTEHYQLVSKDKYFEMGLEGLIVDFEQLGLYNPLYNPEA